MGSPDFPTTFFFHIHLHSPRQIISIIHTSFFLVIPFDVIQGNGSSRIDFNNFDMLWMQIISVKLTFCILLY